jgi:hypothetical protein
VRVVQRLEQAIPQPGGGSERVVSYLVRSIGRTVDAAEARSVSSLDRPTHEPDL